jgi:hypothetical protein
VPCHNSQPWGADKVCEDCIEGWLDERDEEEELENDEEEEELDNEEREWREMIRRGGRRN